MTEVWRVDEYLGQSWPILSGFQSTRMDREGTQKTW